MTGIYLTWDQLGVLLAIAAGVGLAGHLSGALWYTKRQRVRFEADVDRKLAAARASIVTEVTGKIPPAPKIPDVPTVADIISALPDPPDLTDKLALMEERMGSKLMASLDAKMPGIEDRIVEKAGKVFQANIASAKHAFSEGMKGVEESFAQGEGSELLEVLGAFMDQDDVRKIGRFRGLWKRFNQQGGLGGMRGGANGGQQGQWQLGQQVTTSEGTFVLSQQGWKKIGEAAPRAPPPEAAPPAETPRLELPPAESKK